MAERRGFHRQQPGSHGIPLSRPPTAARQRPAAPDIDLVHHIAPHRYRERPAATGPTQPPPDGRTARRRADASRWHWLLFLPILLPLATPLYNRVEPAFFGLPFFFWCQLAFAIFSTTVITVVQLLRKGP